jgi:putative cell wall-binding protein
VTTNQIGGANRYDTARLAAAANFPGGASTVVLASGENFPDGLSSSTLAGALGVPLLLTPTASLAPETVSSLATLHAHTVQIVGGPAAVSAAVIAQLQGLGYTVPAAIAGADRYATSAAVATAASASAPVGTVNGLKTAIIATGANFPDALSAGSAAYFAHLPILLTDPNTLSASVGTAVTTLGIKNALIMGGPSAVSAGVETAIKALNGGVTTTRVAGATRFETAADMAQLDINPAFSGGLGMPAANIVLASGLNFPDALVAAEFKAPIILNDAFPPASATFLSNNAALITTITAIGGPAVISAADLAAAAAAVSPAAGAATFAAVAGGTSFTVTFAAPVNTPLVVGNFLYNNGALPAGSVVGQTGPASFLVTLGGTVLKAGDILAINTANAPTAVSNGAAVPASAFTVPAATNPAVTGVQFFTNGTAVSVMFNKPVTPASVANVTLNGAALGAPTATSADGTTFTWSPVAAIASTAVLTVPTTVVDFSALPVLAQTSYSPVSNTVAPTISAAIHSVFSTTQGNFAAGGGFGLNGMALTISAKKGAAADGSAGGAFLIASAVPTAGTLTVTTATVAGVTTVTVAYPAGLYTTGAQLATALNANAVFNAILVANGTGNAGVGGNTATTAVAGVPLAGGTTTFNISAVLSKPVVPSAGLTNPGAWTVSSGAGTVAVTPNNLAQPSVITVTVVAGNAGQTVVPGTTTLSFNGAAAVVDFAGNAMPSQTITVS